MRLRPIAPERAAVSLSSSPTAESHAWSAILDTILLLALPASGKSLVRRDLARLTPEQCKGDRCMGPTLQLDDYPYVHFMNRVDDELVKRGAAAIFYKGPERTLQDDFTWGALIELLNDDFDDLVESRVVGAPSAAQHLFDRFDEARARVGRSRALEQLPYGVRRDAAAAMEAEVAAFVREKNATVRQEKRGRTIVIEAARGGPNGAAFPLTLQQGYQYSLSLPDGPERALHEPPATCTSSRQVDAQVPPACAPMPLRFRSRGSVELGHGCDGPPIHRSRAPLVRLRVRRGMRAEGRRVRGDADGYSEPRARPGGSADGPERPSRASSWSERVPASTHVDGCVRRDHLRPRGDSTDIDLFQEIQDAK